MDDFQKFHLQKAAKRRPLANVTMQANKLRPQSKIHKPMHSNPQKPSIISISSKTAQTKTRKGLQPLTQVTKSLAFSSRSESEPKQDRPEPRYRDISRSIIEPLSANSGIEFQSNAYIRAFTQWYKIRNYSFVKKHDTSHGGVSGSGANKSKNQDLVEKGHEESLHQSLLGAQAGLQRPKFFLVLEVSNYSRFMLAVTIALLGPDTGGIARDDARVHNGLCQALLINPDSRIAVRKNDRIFLDEAVRYDLSIDGRMLPVYAVWKIAREP